MLSSSLPGKASAYIRICPRCCIPSPAEAFAARRRYRPRALSPARLCVVYGHGGDAVRAALPAADLSWALQSPQLGTDHAVSRRCRS